MMNSEDIKKMDMQTLIDTASKMTFQIQSLAGVLETDVCDDEQSTIEAWWDKTGCNVISHLARTIQGLVEDQRRVLDDCMEEIQRNSGWIFTEEAKDKYPRLNRIVEDANEAAETGDASLLISTLTNFAEKLKETGGQTDEYRKTRNRTD